MSADWLNYHHLLYFWTVALEGSVAAACEKLQLAQPTISGQLKKLENHIGGKLYHHVGRDLVLTELGDTVFRYADRIFSEGQELAELLQGRSSGEAVHLRVGVPGVLPKLIAFRLLRPALSLTHTVRLICEEGSQEHLLTKLAAHELDVVFSDTPAGGFVRVKVFNHWLGESGVGLFGTQQLIDQYRDSATNPTQRPPLLVPSRGTVMRRSLDRWLEETSIRFHIVGEFDDTALMKVFGEAGVGFVAAPLVIEREIGAQFGLFRWLLMPEAREQFFATTVERKVRNPMLIEIVKQAREELFDANHTAISNISTQLATGPVDAGPLNGSSQL